jgi:hypothetical protein
VARNDYSDMLRAARRLSAIRGAELVRGFGSARLPGVHYAELLIESGLVDGVWRFGVRRLTETPGLPSIWGPEAVRFAGSYAIPIGIAEADSGGNGGGGSEGTKSCAR